MTPKKRRQKVVPENINPKYLQVNASNYYNSFLIKPTNPVILKKKFGMAIALS
jgi:hypothetical protein